MRVRVRIRVRIMITIRVRLGLGLGCVGYSKVIPNFHINMHLNLLHFHKREQSRRSVTSNIHNFVLLCTDVTYILVILQDLIRSI